jgi:hypothetical protein
MRDATYIVRLDDGIVSVDADELRQLVDSGRVTRSTEISSDGGAFVRADALSELGPLFGAPIAAADPWGAWDGVDELDEEVAVDEVTSHEEEVIEPGPEVLEEAALEPLAEQLPPVAEALDEGAVQSIEPDPEPRRKLVIGGDKGQVIDFPGRRRAASRGGAEPARDLSRPDLGAQDLTPLPEPSRRQPPQRAEPRERRVEPESRGVQTGHFYLAGLLAAGLLGVGVYVWHVSSVATWTSADPLGHGMGVEAPLSLGEEPVVVEAVDPTPLVEPVAEGDALSPIVAELKADMSHDLAEIASLDQDPAAFEDALFFELSAVGVNVRSIDLEVLGWREDGVPGVVSLTVDLRSRGEVTRELGAAALVFGKYVEHHDFTVRGFQVRLTDEEAGTAAVTQVDPEKAAALYVDRMGLVEVLGL